jgi:hypothetical protein
MVHTAARSSGSRAVLRCPARRAPAGRRVSRRAEDGSRTRRQPNKRELYRQNSVRRFYVIRRVPGAFGASATEGTHYSAR